MKYFTRGALYGVVAANIAFVMVLAMIWFAQGAHAASGCRATVAHPRWCAKVTVVGHRAEEGPKRGTNENTLKALRHDHRWGTWFETDQWNLKDGTPVILHDSTLRRVVDPASMPAGVTGASRPGQLTLSQWKHLRTKGGHRLPTLHQWIRHAQKWRVPGMVEVKYTPVDPARVAAWVNRSTVRISFYSSPNVFAGVCHQAGTQAMRDVGMTVGLKYNRACPQTLTESANWGYSYVINSASKLTPTYVAQAHHLGLKVGDFLSKSKTSWRKLVSARVDYLLVPHVRPAVRWVS